MSQDQLNQNNSHPVERKLHHLSDVVFPSGEALAEVVSQLKKEKKAIILADEKQIREVQNLADIVGTAQKLITESQATEAETIVLCSSFAVAKFVKYFNPNKKILLPEYQAEPSRFELLRQLHPEALLIADFHCEPLAFAHCDRLSYNIEHAIDTQSHGKELVYIAHRTDSEHTPPTSDRLLAIYREDFCTPQQLFLTLKYDLKEIKSEVHKEGEEPISFEKYLQKISENSEK